ncbi:hypothetical protein BD626DRAFT_79507 [Schizophyllum amplum]|uniref:Uncharacterized protein n=1 Tax=Schizophyllum amplum TaxID=97359 RepID=A0A550CA36_9AGAR|nr:hypothetical protein BD626DRAFT_79507 [Auriculariopsis ampla]
MLLDWCWDTAQIRWPSSDLRGLMDRTIVEIANDLTCKGFPRRTQFRRNPRVYPSTSTKFCVCALPQQGGTRRRLWLRLAPQILPISSPITWTAPPPDPLNSSRYSIQARCGLVLSLALLATATPLLARLAKPPFRGTPVSHIWRLAPGVSGLTRLARAKEQSPAPLPAHPDSPRRETCLPVPSPPPPANGV